ncbi:MAG: PQQ-binding-like beta-propeller repeat protein [Elusimicrobia bacterium]|nr:PQQ-binding-like beta-propeller repeat protein [Elusimicrobiota bacterium]
MSNRAYIFFALLAFSAAGAGAYEKIEFRSQLLNPAFMKLSAVAVAQGRTYVADAKANCIFIFDADGKLLRKAEGGLNGPQALAFGGGRLYVADTGNSRIVVFDAEGKALWAFAGEGEAPGQLSGPRGVAYGPDDRVYVSNTGNSRVDVFNSDGVYLYGFPAGRADGQTKLEPAKIELSYSGDVYVSDPGKALLQKYDRTGRLIKEYPMANDGATPDLNGTIYTINAKEGKVREMAGSGEVIGTFGTRGKGKSEFKKLTDIAIDEAGILYLCDEENKKVVSIRLESAEGGVRLERAQVLDRFTVKGPAAKYPFKAEVFAVTPDNSIVAYLPEAREIVLFSSDTKRTLVKAGSAQGQVKNPRGIFVGPKGMIYVADSGNDRVQIFNPDGTYSNMFGESGSDEGQFRNPVSVAVNSKGNIYVADNKNKRIKAFSPDGMFLFSAGPVFGDITLMSPVAVRCDENKNVYILDSVLKKVIVTDAMGKFLRAWDDSGSLQDPAALIYDNKGFFYILDKGSFNVKIFDAAGRFTASFFAKGRGERELWTPQNLAFRNDRVYISDLENARIVAFDISYLPEAPAALKAEAGKTRVDLSWTARPNAWTSGVKVYRAAGEKGELQEVGASTETKLSDTGLAPDTTYYYYAAGVSVSGVRGGLSASAQVYFKGPEAVKAAAPAAGTGAAVSGSRNAAPMEILSLGLNYIFSANYKYYMKNPIGKIAVRNNTGSDFSNLKVSVDLKDFMDYPTDTSIAEIKPKETVEVDLMATLNNKILTINEDTPIQCHLTLTYYQDGTEKTVTLNQPIKVLSKNAIIWDNSARLANFVTASDTPIKALKSSILGDKETFIGKADFLNDTVVEALMIWEGLGQLGINYQSNPVSPFSAMKSSGSAEFPLDSVQFPRQTIKLKSGNCADVAALYAAVFSAAAIETAVLDYPGHIALMVNTGESDAKNVGIPEEYLIKYSNTWWVGIEGTMTGKDFYDSVKHEADLYKSMVNEVKVIPVGDALKQFEPVTLPETEFEPKLDMAAFGRRVTDAINAIRTTRYEYFKNYYGQILLNSPDDVDANTNLGILEAQYDKDGPAADYFGNVLKKDPVNAAALNNLGNLRFRKGNYDEAREYYFSEEHRG